ncbi:hypothetical protein O6H91_Y323700 [Diphasiastrum complanatum]|nr:hypothetical protein O6H91_Y323700 [Diphasiastrum complanatum]
MRVYKVWCSLILTQISLGESIRFCQGLLHIFHVGLTANILLFSPTAGMRVEGKVNKIEKDYIGVLTMGIFNAALSVMDIRDDLYFEELPHERIWTSKTDHQHVIKLGSMLSFVIKSVQETGEFLDISGSLCSPDTGCLDWISGLNEPRHVLNDLENRIESSKEKRKKEKKRRRDT